MGGFAYEERTADVNARILAQVERRDYLEKVYSSDSAFFADGAVVWSILPRQLLWSAEDFGREVRFDVNTPDTPNNRVQVNSFSTGPDSIFRLTSSDSSLIGARYGRFDVAGGEGDFYRYAAYARLLHQLSPDTALSLNYEPVRAHFDSSALYTQVLREDRFIRYETRSVADNLTIEAGDTRVTRPNAETLHGRLARIAAGRSLTSDSTIRVSASESYSDTFTDLLGGVKSVTLPQEQAPLPPLSGTLANTTDNVYYSKRGDLVYAKQGDRFGYSLRGYARRVDYLQLPQDYDERGAILDWTWFYSGDTRISVQTQYLKRKFLTPQTFTPVGGGTTLTFDQEDTERTTSAGVAYRLTSNVNVTFQFMRIERQTTAPPATPQGVAVPQGGNFVDWRVLLLVGYSSGPLFPVQSRR
jgi:hypothetical protein